jgi:hypothetical protein
MVRPSTIGLSHPLLRASGGQASPRLRITLYHNLRFSQVVSNGHTQPSLMAGRSSPAPCRRHRKFNSVRHLLRRTEENAHVYFHSRCDGTMVYVCRTVRLASFSHSTRPRS